MKFTAPTGYKLTKQVTADTKGSKPDPTTGFTGAIPLAQGQKILDIDAGIVIDQQGEIGDFVWDDLNENGLHDPNEPGVNGVTVELYSSTGTLIKQTTTANDATGNPGYYLFTGLVAGSYQVKFIAPTGYMLTKQVTTEANGSKPNPTTGFTSTIALGVNQKILTIDAGVFAICYPPVIYVEDKCMQIGRASCRGRG